MCSSLEEAAMSKKNYSVAPELVEAMRAAFQKACAELCLNDSADVRAEIVATKIVEQATTGESDPDRLCNNALAALSEQRKAS